MRKHSDESVKALHSNEMHATDANDQLIFCDLSAATPLVRSEDEVDDGHVACCDA